MNTKLLLLVALAAVAASAGTAHAAGLRGSAKGAKAVAAAPRQPRDATLDNWPAASNGLWTVLDRNSIVNCSVRDTVPCGCGQIVSTLVQAESLFLHLQCASDLGALTKSLAGQTLNDICPVTCAGKAKQAPEPRAAFHVMDATLDDWPAPACKQLKGTIWDPKQKKCWYKGEDITGTLG